MFYRIPNTPLYSGSIEIEHLAKMGYLKYIFKVDQNARAIALMISFIEE